MLNSTLARDPIADWNKAFAYTREAISNCETLSPSPHEFFDAIQSGLSESLRITVTIDPQANRFEAQIIGMAEDGTHIYRAIISVVPQQYAVLAHADVLVPELRSIGIMKPLLGNLVNRYALPHTNIERLFVGAENPYTWVLYGFLPEPNQWQRRIAPDISEQFEHVKQHVGSELVAKVDGVLQSNDPTGIRDIANIRDHHVGKVPLGRFLLSDFAVRRWSGHLDIRGEQSSASLYYFNRHINSNNQMPIDRASLTASPPHISGSYVARHRYH